MDESVKYNITNTGGQVIVATDNALVSATMNNRINLSTLNSLLKKVKDAAINITEDDMTAIYENIEVIENEARQDKPRKSFLKTAITSLQAMKGTTEFAAAVATLVEFIKTIL